MHHKKGESFPWCSHHLKQCFKEKSYSASPSIHSYCLGLVVLQSFISPLINGENTYNWENSKRKQGINLFFINRECLISRKAKVWSVSSCSNFCSEAACLVAFSSLLFKPNNNQFIMTLKKYCGLGRKYFWERFKFSSWKWGEKNWDYTSLIDFVIEQN